MDNAENNLKKLISLIRKALYPPPPLLGGKIPNPLISYKSMKISDR